MMIVQGNSDVLSSTTPLNLTQTSFSFKSPNPAAATTAVWRSNQGRIAQALLQNRALSIEQLHRQLSKIIDSMDNRIQKVINRHDDQFLTAYRAQMIKVQRQLAYLKQKANQQEFSLRRDQRINALENSLVWFRNQAVRLGKQKEDNRQKYKMLQVKYDSMIEDKKFLQEQAIASKKQIKNMRQTMQRMMRQDKSQSQSQKQNSLLKYSNQSARGSQLKQSPFGRQKLSQTGSNYNTSVESFTQNQRIYHKNSLFTQRDRNNSITEDISTTTKLPKLSPSPLTVKIQFLKTDISQQESSTKQGHYSSQKKNETHNNFPPIEKSSSFDVHNNSTQVSNIADLEQSQQQVIDDLNFLGQANFMPGIPNKRDITSTSQNEIAMNRSRMGYQGGVAGYYNANLSAQRREAQTTDIENSQQQGNITNNDNINQNKVISIQSPKIILEKQKYLREKKRNHSPSSMRYQNQADQDDEQELFQKIQQAADQQQQQQTQSKLKLQQQTNRQIALIPEKQLPAPQTIPIQQQSQPQTKLSSFVFQLLDAGIDRSEVINQIDNYMIQEQNRVNQLLTTLRYKIESKYQQPSANTTFARRTVNLNATDIHSTNAVNNSSFNKSLSLARVDTKQYLEKMKDPFNNVPNNNRSKIKARSIVKNKSPRGLSFPEKSFKELQKLVGQQQQLQLQRRLQGKKNLNHTIKDGVLMLKKQ